MADQEEILNKLAQNIGSETFIKEPLSRCLSTEGFTEFCELCGCYWLYTDSAIMLMMDSKYKGEDFIHVKITKTNSEAEVIYGDGNGKILYEKRYSYTDFPLQEYEFYAVRNEIGSFTFMLKSEY